MLAALAGDLTISDAASKKLLADLPSDLDPERRAVVETACRLVGKVNYFWGGKSLVIGWDSRWASSPRYGQTAARQLESTCPTGWIAVDSSIGYFIMPRMGNMSSATAAVPTCSTPTVPPSPGTRPSPVIWYSIPVTSMWGS